MEFPQCKVRSVKADIANGEMTISFSMSLNDQNMETAENLSQYADKDMGHVSVQVIPHQLPLKGLSGLSQTDTPPSAPPLASSE